MKYKQTIVVEADMDEIRPIRVSYGNDKCFVGQNGPTVRSYISFTTCSHKV